MSWYYSASFHCTQRHHSESYKCFCWDYVVDSLIALRWVELNRFKLIMLISEMWKYWLCEWWRMTEQSKDYNFACSQCFVLDYENEEELLTKMYNNSPPSCLTKISLCVLKESLSTFILCSFINSQLIITLLCLLADFFSRKVKIKASRNDFESKTRRRVSKSCWRKRTLNRRFCWEISSVIQRIFKILKMIWQWCCESSMNLRMKESQPRLIITD